jgi:hypothetical protein
LALDLILARWLACAAKQALRWWPIACAPNMRVNVQYGADFAYFWCHIGFPFIFAPKRDFQNSTNQLN